MLEATNGLPSEILEQTQSQINGVFLCLGFLNTPPFLKAET
jgi:hypothetical protein